jgi:predicted transcriptional regulator
MTLTLHLPPETENRLRELATLTGKNPEAVALEALREKLSDESAPLPQSTSAAEFKAWLATHPSSTTANFDDSRESIYEGRGE